VVHRAKWLVVTGCFNVFNVFSFMMGKGGAITLVRRRGGIRLALDSMQRKRPKGAAHLLRCTDEGDDGRGWVRPHGLEC
jgi:hypothetical protein